MKYRTLEALVRSFIRTDLHEIELRHHKTRVKIRRRAETCPSDTTGTRELFRSGKAN